MTNPKIEEYILDHIAAEDPILIELDRETNLSVVQPRMLSGHLQGEFLRIFTQIINPGRVLELGTFTGYSAITIARGLALGAMLHTIELNDELESIASKFFRKAGVSDKIIQHFGSALEVIPRLDEVFDLIFIDADKREYPDYLNLIMSPKYVRKGTIIMADNVLWYGKVAQEADSKDRYTQGLLEFNRMVAEDPRLDKVILPLRDGLTVAVVRDI